MFTVPHSGTRSLWQVLKRYFDAQLQHLLDAKMGLLEQAIAAGGPIVTTARPLHLIELGWRKRGGDAGHPDPLSACLANQVELYRAVARAGLELHVFEFDTGELANDQRNAALAYLLGVDQVEVEWPNLGVLEHAPGGYTPVPVRRTG